MRMLRVESQVLSSCKLPKWVAQAFKVRKNGLHEFSKCEKMGCTSFQSAKKWVARVFKVRKSGSASEPDVGFLSRGIWFLDPTDFTSE